MGRPNQRLKCLAAILALGTLVCVQGCGWKKSRVSVPAESSVENQETPHLQPSESACSRELAMVRQEMSEKETMIFDLQSRIKFLEQKNASLEKILAQKEAVQKRVPVTVSKTSPVASRPVAAHRDISVDSSISPEDLYKNSHIFLKKKQYPEAQRGFAAFARRYSTHSFADNALYWLGECHYTQGQYKKALEIFTILRERYPKGEKVPDALLKTGYAYAALGDRTQAKKYLSLLLKTYPFSLAAPKAQARLKELE